MPVDHILLSEFSMKARIEQVVGRGVPHNGLLPEETTLARVEEMRALASLTEFGMLRANWDGYGALAIDVDAIRNSKAMIGWLIRQAPGPEIAPTSNGTISFEWVSERGSAHLEMGKTRFSFYVKPSGGPALLLDGMATEVPFEIGALIAAMVFPPVRSVAAITRLRYTAGHEQRAC